MVEKRYVAKKRIPEYCPFGSVMSLKVESENDAPACFGRVVGYQYEGSDEVVSTIEGDNLKAKGERIIDRLMYDGYLVKHQTVKKIDNLGTVNVTQYGIMYEAESAAQHKGTPTHGIPSPTAGQFICTFELLMVTEINGELYERYITIRKKTPPVFRFTTTDFFCNMGSYSCASFKLLPPKHYRHTNHQHNSQNRRSTASYFRRSDACITVSRYVWRLIICRDWLSLFYRDA